MAMHVNKLLQRAQQLSHSQVDAKPFIYVRSKWQEQEQEADLLMLLSANNQSYAGTLKYSEIRSAAEDLEQPYEAFFEECQKALITHMGLPEFDYQLEVNDEQPVFKLFKCQGFETLYIELPMRKVPHSQQLLDAAIELVQQPAASASTSAAEGVGDGDGVAAALAEFKLYMEQSKQQERKLLKKFVLLLNSKKARIEELEEQLKGRATAADDSEEEPTAQPAEADVDADADSDDDFLGATQRLTQTQPAEARKRSQRILDDTVEQN